jgi:hypothetical protein
MKEHLDAWRTFVYFIGFGFFFALFTLPLQVARLVDDAGHPVLALLLVVLSLVFYVPFAAQWASKACGLRPPTREDVERQHREVIAAKNAELRGDVWKG